MKGKRLKTPETVSIIVGVLSEHVNNIVDKEFEKYIESGEFLEDFLNGNPNKDTVIGLGTNVNLKDIINENRNSNNRSQ